MSEGKSLDLTRFKIPLGKLAPLETFITRQKIKLSYRTYPAWSEDLVILYHGVGSDSRYMCVLASAIAQAGLATVITPDFRGHGASLGASDVIPSAQLEIDLEELIIHIRMQRAVSRVTLAGHSLGGGFALRVATSDIRARFAKYVALSPYLPQPLYSFQLHYGGFIKPEADGGFSVNLPEVFRSGNEKLHYGSEYLQAVAPPDDVIEKLKLYHPNVKVASGAEDELEDIPCRLELFAKAEVSYSVLENLNHLSIVSKPEKVLALF